ncbi:hypothetical protein CR513_12441, partial [Mucuna pruriens]
MQLGDEIPSGVATGFHLSFLLSASNSFSYFCWDIKIPSFEWATSIPRKYLSFPNSFISNSRIKLGVFSEFSTAELGASFELGALGGLLILEVLEVQRTHKGCVPSLEKKDLCYEKVTYTSSALVIGLDKLGPLEIVLPIERWNNVAIKLAFKCNNKATNAIKAALARRRERLATIKATFLGSQASSLFSPLSPLLGYALHDCVVKRFDLVTRFMPKTQGKSHNSRKNMLPCMRNLWGTKPSCKIQARITKHHENGTTKLHIHG